MTDEMKRKIDALTREEMARHWRFATLGDPMFRGDGGKYFEQRFKEFGGFSPEISKKIGWSDEAWAEERGER